MKTPPWFDPNWRVLFLAHLRRIWTTEALAVRAGRKIRPGVESGKRG